MDIIKNLSTRLKEYPRVCDLFGYLGGVLNWIGIPIIIYQNVSNNLFSIFTLVGISLVSGGTLLWFTSKQHSLGRHLALGFAGGATGIGTAFAYMYWPWSPYIFPKESIQWTLIALVGLIIYLRSRKTYQRR